MASRYSRIFLRPAKETTVSSESWGGSSTGDPHSTTGSVGFSYPPSSLPSHDADSPVVSPPHPYTLAALHSPIDSTFREPQRPPDHIQQNTREFDAEKKVNNNPASYQPENRSRRSRSLRRMSTISRPPPMRSRPLIVLFLFLPIPPLLAMIYMVAGHAILRGSQSSPNSIYHSPLLSSFEAGATGGVILTLPLALLLYILLYPTKSADAPEDFFEDDSSSIMSPERWLRLTGYAVSSFFLFAIGGISGPLGVTCLSNGVKDNFVDDKRLLSTSAAAAAGFVGGVVLASAGVILFAFGTLLWVWRHRQQSSS